MPCMLVEAEHEGKAIDIVHDDGVQPRKLSSEV